MSVRRVKQKDGERLTKVNIQEVIKALEAEKPITKVAACKKLNIAYNTTRLGNIIEEHKEKAEFTTRRRAELRTTPVSNSDVAYIAQAYLDGEALDYISEITFRSIAVIKRVLTKYNVPLRTNDTSYQNPLFLDPDCIKQEYMEGDLVFSARYNRPATIVSKFSAEVYRILFHGEHRKSAYQPYYELADLTDLQELCNIELEDINKIECNTLILEARQRARKIKSGKQENK